MKKQDLVARLKGMYSAGFTTSDLCPVNPAYAHYAECFEVKQTQSADMVPFHYKKTTDPIHIASLVLDLASFIVGMVSTQHMNRG